MVEAKQDSTPGMATILDNQATVLDDLNEFERAANVRKDAIRIYEAVEILAGFGDGLRQSGQ